MSKKAKPEYVRVDQGQGPAEHWMTARVIQRQICDDLFDQAKTTERLLVELTGGERTWVDFWQPVGDAS